MSSLFTLDRSEASSLAHVGNHVFLGDLARLVGVEFYEGSVEVLLAHVVRGAHRLERVHHEALRLFFVKVTVPVGIVSRPHLINGGSQGIILDRGKRLLGRVRLFKKDISASALSIALLKTYLIVAGFLIRISHDLGWLHGEETHVFVLLSVAHVELAPLALPEIGDGTRPNSRFYDNDIVLLLSMLGVRHVVLHVVSVGAEDPRWIVALACAILSDWLQTRLIWVL